jgi:hypothetical protein
VPDLALAVYEDAHLPARLPGDGPDVLGQLGGYKLRRGNPAPVGAFEGVDLALF